MRRIAFLAVLFLLLVVVVDASILPALEVRAAYARLHREVRSIRGIHLNKRAETSPAPPPPTLLVGTNVTNGEIEGYLDPTSLPTPWPMGFISIVISLATGVSRYKFEPPTEITYFSKIGWGITLVRSIGIGVSAIVNMKKGDYSGVSSDGFPALFSNVFGLMGVGRDHGERWWALGGLFAMFFGIIPRLLQLCLALWLPHTKNWLAPFRWTDGSRCIVNFSSYCNTASSQYNVPYCTAPILQIAGHEAMHSPVDIIRALAWLFVFLLCVGGLIYYCKKENAKLWDRRHEVLISYLALAFSISLVMSSAIIYAKGQRIRAFDCTDLKKCVEKQPLQCPAITVFAPRSPNGFIKEWAKQVSGWDIPALLA